MRIITRVFVVWTVLLLASANSFAQQLEQVVAGLADQISESLAAQEKKKIAILPLTDLAGSRTTLGQLLAEELTNQLFIRKANRFDVVERSKIDAIWEEQELGTDGWLSAESIGGVRNLVGADAILTGSIAELEDRLRINVRLMAVPSGKLFATASDFMLKTGLGPDMMKPLSRTGVEEATLGSAGSRIASQVINSVAFDLIECTKQTRLISCRLIAVNNDVDRNVRVSTQRTAIYDQSGRTFPASRVKAANDEGSSYADARFITEVPISIEIQFEGVPSTIEFIKILSIQTGLGQVEFRDIRF